MTRLEFIAEDGVKLRADILGVDSGIRLIMGHGNGLAINGYESYWSEFLDDFQLVLLDVRGHGMSDSGSLEAHNWGQFVRDLHLGLEALDATLGRRPTVGVFHSLSAIIALRHAQQCSYAWEGLVLFDPPLMPPPGSRYRKAHIDEMVTLADRVRRRQTTFASPLELAAHFRRSKSFATWTDTACQDMARAVLRHESATGVWALSCCPAYEAKVFESNQDDSLWRSIGGLAIPIALVCADPNVPKVQPSAFSGRELAEAFSLQYFCVPGSTHFLQLEFPSECAEITKNIIRGQACIA